ncbi:MAG: Transcriptional regulator, IclR family [Herminiimonas sp.]|nr:Transcriptional regulator, IclR family [Herminiimonas sp.]
MAKAPKQSTKRTRLEQPPQNRSLERGVEILRAFRPGASLMGNGDLAERTGLSRATVSRLTQTLVGTGLLEYDRGRRAYRLAAPVLSFAHSMRSGSPVLQAVGPMMRAVAEKKKINVGLAVADREEMVYLESVRYNRKPTLRNIVAGQRVPIELTSLGRAYLAAVPEAQRQALLLQFKSRRPTGWHALECDIIEAIDSVRRQGYCVAAWQPEVVAVATPIVVEGNPIYVLNLSVSTQAAPALVGSEISSHLMDLAARVHQAIESI